MESKNAVFETYWRTGATTKVMEIIVPTSSHILEIHWSVWDKNPIVSWSCDGILISVTMDNSPIAVCHLQRREMIAVIGDFDEFGSSNLLLYSYDGKLKHTITAPNLGQKSQFGGVAENNGEVYAIVGFQTETGWKEEAGSLNIDDGIVTSLHRSY